MKLFKFFYGMHLSCKLYLTTGNSSKSLHKEIMPVIEGPRIAQLSIWKRNDFENLKKYACRWAIWWMCFRWMTMKVFQSKHQSTNISSPPRGVLTKKCSENMQQICRRRPMPKCDFNNKVHLFLRATSKTWTQILDLDPGLGPRKTWTLKNLGPKKPGTRKTWTIKKREKQGDAGKRGGEPWEPRGAMPPPPISISKPNKVQQFQFQTSGILLFMGVQKLPEISRFLYRVCYNFWTTHSRFF